jgi:hypothetical protein
VHVQSIRQVPGHAASAGGSQSSAPRFTTPSPQLGIVVEVVVVETLLVDVLVVTSVEVLDEVGVLDVVVLAGVVVGVSEVDVVWEVVDVVVAAVDEVVVLAATVVLVAHALQSIAHWRVQRWHAAVSGPHVKAPNAEPSQPSPPST